MIHAAGKILEICALAGMVGGISYYVLCLVAATSYLADRRRARTRVSPSSPVVPVSILKPLKGVDPKIYESFRSHCLQDHPQYEIIFGVSEAEDPAVEAVLRLQQEFPGCAIQLMICSRRLGANRKVSNLAQMLQAARYDYLIVNDSDIRVDPDYVRRVTAPLVDEKKGMVTCLYRGAATGTLASRLEAIGINTDFSAGVLVARLIERGVRFGLGSTLAFRRRELDAIGGFETLVDYLADDYELGKRIAARDLEVQLSEVVVETVLPAYGWRGFLEHQLRWARGVRDSRPEGYFGLVVTFGLFWAALALAASPGPAWVWWLAAMTFTLRLAVALVVGSVVLRDRRLVSLLALVPLRDLVAVLVWLVSFGGNTVSWRGEMFLLKNGKLVRANPSGGEN